MHNFYGNKYFNIIILQLYNKCKKEYFLVICTVKFFFSVYYQYSVIFH